MQRGLDSETKKQLEEEEKKIISEEHWYLDLPELKEKESFIIEEQSFLLCEDLLYGRMSFRGFNPEVEKLMLQMNAKNKAEEVEEETVELDVSDEEMARRHQIILSLSNRICKASEADSSQKLTPGPTPSGYYKILNVVPCAIWKKMKRWRKYGKLFLH
ncbi:M-phase phosphoprotein 6 isoform X3 [Lagenorhynchus albirostris]|nr:M-phase phosphoprotein 6 isoform X3 [Lagenorhynchus albirostris]